MVIIFNNIAVFYSIFGQINATLLSIRYFFKTSVTLSVKTRLKSKKFILR